MNTNTKMSLGFSYAVALSLLLLSSCQRVTERGSVVRGEYLVTTTGCNDCHTPFVLGPEGPEPDMTRMLSGHPSDVDFRIPDLPEDGSYWVGSATNTAFAGPWGVSYSPNLTPDVNTGIGIWTEEMFVKALRTGRHMGTSRMIQPPMPWPFYSKMTDDDLIAIYRYLRSILPVENRVKESLNAEELAAIRRGSEQHTS